MRARGFSLIEVTIVVVVLGIGASLAIPGFRSLITHYRAAESFRQALAAVTAARSLSQRSNAPVRLRVQPNGIEVQTATISGAPESVRRTVTGYTTTRTVPVTDATFTVLQPLTSAGAPSGSAISAGSVTATLTFCPSSDAYYRNNDADATPVCGLGNLASSEAKIVVTAQGETQHVRVRRALGAVDLRSGG